MSAKLKSKSKLKVDALDLATGEKFSFSPTYRWAIEPAYICSPPNFTEGDAFKNSKLLRDFDMTVDDVIYIEWQLDHFARLDENGSIVLGPTVWRPSKFIGLVETVEAAEGQG